MYTMFKRLYYYGGCAITKQSPQLRMKIKSSVQLLYSAIILEREPTKVPLHTQHHNCAFGMIPMTLCDFTVTHDSVLHQNGLWDAQQSWQAVYRVYNHLPSS